VERYCRNFESEPNGHQRYTHRQDGMLSQAFLRDSKGHGGKVRGAGDPINESDAIEEQGRRKGAQKEVLDSSLVRGGPLASDPYQNIRAKGHEFQCEIQDQ
jgi:hypothetical protein